MRRGLLPGLPFTLLLLLGSLQFTGPAYAASAPHSLDCIPDKPCPKNGKKGKDCCQEPPCDVIRRLKRAKAFKILRAGQKASFSTQMTGQWTARWQADINKINSLIPNCPEDLHHPPPPPIQVDLKNLCKISVVEIGGSLTPITRDEALEEINACSELIESYFDFAEASLPLCARQISGEKVGDADKFSETMRANQAQIDSLEGAFLTYFNVCTITPDSKIPMEISDAAINALLNAPPKAAPEKKPPHGKSGKKGRRSR